MIIAEVDDPDERKKRRLSSSSSVQDQYRASYFEALDLAITGITDRFSQKGVAAFEALENYLLKASSDEPAESELSYIKSNYSDDVNTDSLVIEMETFSCNSKRSFANFNDFLLFFKSSPVNVKAYPSVSSLLKLLLLLPATNATSERSFSALKRLKTALRHSMQQSRLNSLLLLHVAKEQTDSLDIQQVIKEFVDCHQTRSKTIAVLKK